MAKYFTCIECGRRSASEGICSTCADDRIEYDEYGISERQNRGRPEWKQQKREQLRELTKRIRAEERRMIKDGKDPMRDSE